MVLLDVKEKIEELIKKFGGDAEVERVNWTIEDYRKLIKK